MSWILPLLLLGVAAAGVGLLVVLLRKFQETSQSLEQLRRLEGIEGLLEQTATRGDDLGLSRIEHAILDLRDTNKRLEERLVQLLEKPAATPEGAESTPARPTSLSERVTTRLLAMGYERIELVTPLETIEHLSDAAEGEVVVEARRAGALHKGRVLVKDGAICDVRLRSSYEAFP